MPSEMSSESTHLSPSGRPHGRVVDGAGFTLIEVLVVITLMGIAVVAVLAGMRATIRSTIIDRNHAVAFAWLQAASDEVYETPRVPCTSGQAAAQSTYELAAKNAAVPPVWSGTSAKIEVTKVEYLGRVTVDSAFEWGTSFCFEGVGTEYEDSPLYTQRVTLRATSPDGALVQTLEMVKSE
jgi:prepilin-type N-terminal cleavage/methylation domain-containing protein